MIRSCSLLCAMPCDQSAASKLFSRIAIGSFAEEWRRSQPKNLTSNELITRYLVFVPHIWNELKNTLADFNVKMVPNATSEDLAEAFKTANVIALLAHHVDDSKAETGGIELFDRVISPDEIGLISPTSNAIIHLGVCRSVPFIEPLKTNCSQVRVIATQAQLEPAFFLSTFAYTVQHWRNVGGDYAERHLALRSEILSSLGVN